MKNIWFIWIICFFLAACQTNGKEPGETEDVPEGPKVTGAFRSAPVLSFTGEIENGTVADDDTIKYSFTEAAPSDSVTYTIYITEGKYNKSADVKKRSELSETRNAGQNYSYNVTAGTWYSALVVAKRGSDEAVSAVRQAQGFSIVTYEPGTGLLVSLGRATLPSAKTYYLAFQNGDDNNSGLSPAAPWKTFSKINKTVLFPGDHILLEAGNTWNGTPTDSSNFRDFATARGNGGMLAPMGSGSAQWPIVIDLYRYDPINKIAYFSADNRPVINGNGTPSLDNANPYAESGVISLEAQDYWTIRNMELTNSFQFPDIAQNPELLNTHWYNRNVRKALVGIGAYPTESHTHNRGIVIENCYIHDVQSEHNNNGNSDLPPPANNYFGGTHTPGKLGGGIRVAVTESMVEGNIVKRVGLGGIKTGHSAPGATRLIFRGNFIETVAGDGLVLAQTVTDNLVESNIVKDSCAAPNLGGGNYAANWNYIAADILYQYNETYGTLYGYLDGEAWDNDNQGKRIIHQYNYSHNNSGGTILFMSDQENSVFRYNISANDGAGSRFLATVADAEGALPVDPNAYTYQRWENGQSFIHYTVGSTSAGPRVPLIYNNTFYLGPGASAAIFGNTTSGGANKYVRFYNNIILKAGSGEVRFNDTHLPGQGNPVGNILNPAGFKNNMFYAYETDRALGDQSKFKTGNVTMADWISQYGNLWADPKLRIQEAGVSAEFRAQRDSTLGGIDINDPEKLKIFTGVNRLRTRAGLFTPLTGSPAIEAGMAIPAGTNVAALDGAWNSNYGALSEHAVYWNASSGLTRDMFGSVINVSKPPVGAAAKVYQ